MTDNSLRVRLEGMLANGRDDALLRFSLGNACLKEGDAAAAVEHLRAAVRRQPDYSAAWKLLGRALAEAGRSGEAITTYRQGIETAERRGDLQAAKEMRVFLRRLENED